MSAAAIQGSSLGRSSTEIQGRAEELIAGLQFLDALGHESGPRAHVIDGSAGIGKTTVWEVLLEQARLRRLRVLVASPSASEAELSFASLTDLLRGIDREHMAALPEPQRRALLVAMLEEIDLDEGARSRTDLRTVAVGFLGVLRALANEGAIVVAIDDVQWLDAASRAAVEFAMRRLGEEPVGLLLTVREESDLALLDFASSLPPDRASVRTLGPLSPAALFQVLRSRLGHAFGRPTLIRIAEWSGGNPLLALEIGREIVREGGTIDPAAPPPIPPDLAQALARRLESVSRHERRTLLVAASAAHPTVERVTAACRRLGWPTKVPADHSLLAAKGSVLVFGHPMVAAQSLAIAPDEDRRAAHRALAALAEDPEERARHLALCAAGPDLAVATALDDAVRHADRRGALEAAIDHAELATRLTPSDDVASLVRRRRVLGEILLRAGETDRAVDELRLALQVAPAGPERALIDAALAEALIQSGSAVEARSLCEAALAVAGSDRLVRARVELTWDRASSEAEEGLAHARAALALLDAGPGDLRARALADVAGWQSELGRAVSPDFLDEAVALEMIAPPPRVLEGARASRAWLLLMDDELDRAHVEYEALRERAEAVGDESSLARILIELAQIDLRAGRWEELASHADEAIRVADRAGRGHDRAMAHIQLGAVAAARGDGEVAARHLDEADAFGMAGGHPMIRAIVAGNRGVVALIDGDFARAHALFTAGQRLLADAHLGDEALMRYQADQIEVLVGLGRIDEADELARAIGDRAAGNQRRRPSALVARGRGFVAAARGDVDAALDAFDRSYRALDALGMRFEAARSRLARGVAHRRRREKRLADEDLSAALETFEALAAPAWVRRTQRELARVGRRPSAPKGLTETESTVARLAADGRTNAEVATAAFMSPRTVEGVLARVYTKLGIRSRAELGRAMARAEGASEAVAGH